MSFDQVAIIVYFLYCRIMSLSKKENIEKLIMNVKNHPVIYDMTLSDFKNVRQKDYIWDNIISKEMDGEKGENLKTKWKNLRDSYQKHLKANSTLTGQAANASKGKQLDPYKNYFWSKQLEFLRPHVRFATTISNVQKIDTNSADEIFDDASCEDVDDINTQTITPPSTTSRIKHTREKDSQINVSSVDKVLEHLNKRPKMTPSALDAVDLLMLSHAKTIKTFSLKRQALAKKKKSEIIGDMEIEQIEENENNQRNECQTFAYGLQHQKENEYGDFHQSEPLHSHFCNQDAVMNLSVNNDHIINSDSDDYNTLNYTIMK